MRERQVTWRAAEHIRDQHHALTQIDRFDGRGDLVAPLVHVVVRTDANRFDMALDSHNVLHGGKQLRREVAVGDNDNAQHLRSKT